MTWSERLKPNTSRAAAFWARYSGCSVDVGSPAVTVVQPGHYERQDQLLCDFLADPTTNLAQTTNVVEASSSDFG